MRLSHRSIEDIKCSSEFPRNIPRKFRGTSVWGFKISNFTKEIELRTDVDTHQAPKIYQATTTWLFLLHVLAVDHEKNGNKILGPSFGCIITIE
ncbi:hypothetical protein YC2023_015603 [Brassica napus]